MRSSTLIQQLQQSLDSAEDYDITFIVDGEEIHAHKYILKLRSLFMKEKLSRFPIENRERKIIIRNGKAQDFKSFLSFLYTDDCDLSDLNVEMLLFYGYEWRVLSLVEKMSNIHRKSD
uniref:BTB domain-containing protein n=1 Tax=Panagrolaimus sp. PS1159 TaxID=55785 RepID=A0AC35FX54_9BILA